MKYKIYAFGWAYWISGNTNTKIMKLNELANDFANEIGVSIESVLYEGVITKSVWCRNFQLFSAPVPEKPEGYQEIKINAFNYIKGDY